MLGLYLHVPFCTAICGYCNFNRGLFDGPLKDAYVAALEQEIRRAGDGAPVDTIYFGGGTPSLLDPHEVARVLDTCHEVFAVDRGAEVSIEANPETASPERLRGFRTAGVNRLSFGVQSFHDDELRRLGRMHSAAPARAAFQTARATGWDNISLDLMMWLPEQTPATFLESVDELIALGPDHASLYILELYPNAPLKEDMARAGWSQAPDEDAADMYLQAFDSLDAAGYEQYEISNVARPGKPCRHNLKYWSDGEWLAFGCGAHGTRAGRRWRNVSGTAEYVERIKTGRPVVAEERVLTPREQREEALMTGLRLTRGLDLAEVGRRHHLDVWSEYGRALESFVDSGLLEYTPPVLRLNRRGMLLANEVCSVFV